MVMFVGVVGLSISVGHLVGVEHGWLTFSICCMVLSLINKVTKDEWI